MLDELDLSLSLSKRAYKLVMHDLVKRMYELEHLAYTTEVPVIILFEGWDAAGKGTAISMLTERLDPRGFKVLPTQARAPMRNRNLGSGASGCSYPDAARWRSSTAVGTAACSWSASKG